MTFIPTNYQKPAGGGDNYFKPVKGENRVRIITAPVMGYIDWDNSGDKPKKFITREKQEAISSEKPKHLRAMGVLHEGKTKLREITQVSIQDFIHQHALDADWGDPREYDLVITKTGEGKDGTKYSCIAKPKKELSDEDKANIKPLNLDALFDGGDPFDVNNDIETPF